MTKSPRKNAPNVGIELGAACMPSEHASDQVTVPGMITDYTWLLQNMYSITADYDYRLRLPQAWIWVVMASHISASTERELSSVYTA